MYCGECGEKNKKNSLFCEKCGAKLENDADNVVVTGSEKPIKQNKNYIFCEECGTKNIEGSLFCEKCGKKIVDNEVKEELPKKKMGKKCKVIIISVIVVVLLLFGAYKVGEELTSPKHIAKDYIDSLINKNASKLYSFLAIDGDTTFASKKVFEELYDKMLGEIDVVNYNIGDVTYSDGKLSANVSFTYTTKSYSSERSSSINLIKEKGKKFLIFDKWKINTIDDIEMVKDLIFKVPSGSKLIYSGVEVTDKYLDKKNVNGYDTYKLPIVFSAETNVEITLSNGISVKNTIYPSYYDDSFTFDLEVDDLSEEEQNKILDVIKDSVNNLYSAVINNKDWSSIKDSFSNASKDMEDNYNDFYDEVNDSTRTLKSFSYKSGILDYIELNSDGYLELEVKIRYDYSVEYTNYNNDVKTSSKSNSSYMTFVIGHNENGYYLYDIDELQTYFYS